MHSLYNKNGSLIWYAYTIPTTTTPIANHMTIHDTKYMTISSYLESWHCNSRRPSWNFLAQRHFSFKQWLLQVFALGRRSIRLVGQHWVSLDVADVAVTQEIHKGLASTWATAVFSLPAPTPRGIQGKCQRCQDQIWGLTGPWCMVTALIRFFWIHFTHV